jgi:hypothetical protein
VATGSTAVTPSANGQAAPTQANAATPATTAKPFAFKVHVVVDEDVTLYVHDLSAEKAKSRLDDALYNNDLVVDIRNKCYDKDDQTFYSPPLFEAVTLAEPTTACD